MAKVTVSIPQGTRDFGPETLRKRNYIFDTIRNVFELYGFQPLETPAMENLETLMGKYGEEGDKLIFKILNNGLDNPSKEKQARDDFEKVLQGTNAKGITERALKYDLTIPFARYVAMSPRRITVSTAGVAKMIKQLGDDKVKFKLALSLHAASDVKRHEIMPINDTNNIKSLIDALNYFYKQTKNEISFEYILFNDFNDSLKDADDLIKIYRQVPADLVNIIEYNPIEFAQFSKPTEERTGSFMKYLEKNKVNARLRRSRGKDIDAACGQLANKGN